MTTARILVTGSRAWTDTQALEDALLGAWHDATQAGHTAIVVVHGTADGADTLADTWARANAPHGVTAEPHPADWDHCAPECPTGHRKPRRNGKDYCPTAGHRRNQLMVDLGADLCLAFPHGPARGTRDCLTRASRAGIPTQEVQIRSVRAA